MIKITALVDNTPGGNRTMVHTHGLSFFIETYETSILFDFGPGPEFLQNAGRLGIDPLSAGYTVCSHSHYDHAAGYKALLQAGISCPFITGDHFFEEKYTLDKDDENAYAAFFSRFSRPVKYSYLGCGFSGSDLKKAHVEHIVCKDMLKIVPGCYAVGSFPRIYAFETIPHRFVKWNGVSMEPDSFDDEIILVLDHPQGLIVVTGCCHPGILNILSTIHTRFSRPVQAIVGGIHLTGADDLRVNRTMCLLKEQGIRFFALNHCSGDSVNQWLKKDGAVSWCRLGSGDCVVFP